MKQRAPQLAGRWEPPLAGFVALSLAAHVAAFASTRWGRPPPPVFEPPAQALAVTGDTFEVEPATEPPVVDADDLPEAIDEPPSPAQAQAPATATAPARAPAPATALARALAPAPAPAHAPAPPPSPPPLFGAVGERLATDLATTFTRALPQVASADAAWSRAPFGSTTVATVTLVLGDDGRLTQRTITGAPSEALRHGIERTLVLLAAREFTARAATTKLRVAARVSRDDVHDGFHGDVFALSGGSFAGDVGMAFFALPAAAGPGRRVDVELRLLP